MHVCTGVQTTRPHSRLVRMTLLYRSTGIRFETSTEGIQMKTLERPLVSLAFLLLLCTAAHGELPRILPDQQLTAEYASIPVAVYGRFALVGRPPLGLGPNGDGYVEIYERVQHDGCTDNQACWVLAGRLPRPPEMQLPNQYGSTVALDGHTALVGAPDAVAGRDAVYVYRRRADGDWLLRQTLRSGIDAIPTNFGWHVALAGDSAAVIAGGQVDVTGEVLARSALYVFHRSRGGDWSRVLKFEAPEGEFFNAGALALDGTTLMLHSNGDVNQDFGLVYVWRRHRNHWMPEPTIRSPDVGVFGDQAFGRSIDVNGRLAVIANPFHDARPGKGGAAYIYLRTHKGWRFVQKIVPTTDDLWESFGVSAIVHGRNVAVGATRFSDDSGALYVFQPQRTGWVDTLKFWHPGQTSPPAGAVSFDGRTLLICSASGICWVWNIADHVRAGH
jgi:hypothetical protein